MTNAVSDRHAAEAEADRRLGLCRRDHSDRPVHRDRSAEVEAEPSELAHSAARTTPRQTRHLELLIAQ